MSDSKAYLDMDLLRFTTAGSVDDGKSTLIGRLLYDSKAIFEDQLEAIEESSRKRGDENVNLALLTDGLRAEREQGITIDVAYRYFATPRRKFIIADTPGHVQYTRNMVTGASTANLAIILVDARKGVVEQTCRHSFIASLLQIQHIVVCVNKMDLVDYSEEVYQNIVKDYKDFASRLDVPHIEFIPISALNGDNVVDKSTNMDWYQGSSLLYYLETVYLGQSTTTSMHASLCNGSSAHNPTNITTSADSQDVSMAASSRKATTSPSCHPDSAPRSKRSSHQTAPQTKPSPHPQSP